MTRDTGILIGRQLQGDQRFDVDTVIVGTGSSGAVIAAELSAAGERVLMLEEGPFVDARRHGQMRPSQSLREVWREGGMSAAVAPGRTPVVNVTMGRCVGGSSMLTGGVCFRTPGHVLHDWVNDHRLSELNEKALEPLFERVEERIHVEEVPAAMRSRSTSLWGEGAEKMGGCLKPNRRNTKNCDGCSQCNFGCPQQSKLSVDLTFLPDARRDGAQILSDCLVRRVLMRGGRAVGVVGHLLDADKKKRGRVEVRARRVVLAAGAAHTPLILKRSRIGSRRHLGRNLTLHPSFRMIARFDEPVEGWKGAMQSAHSTSWESEGLTMMSVYVPPPVVVSALPGVGPRFTDKTRELPHLAMFGGLIHDEAGGRILRGPGREPIMYYKMTPGDRAKIPRLIRLLGEAYLEAGARELFLPIIGHDSVSADEFRRLDLESVSPSRYECSSQHPLGTTRMSADARSGVVDPRGRVWGTDNLYVVDGGILPTSLGVNPQLSIMTMAMRLAHLMLDDRQVRSAAAVAP